MGQAWGRHGALRGKATDLTVTRSYLCERAARLEKGGYQVSRWIEFCFVMLRCGYEVSLYEARKTFSKYITVKNGDWWYKVRFSNHRPIRAREAQGDCDFFVGITNFQTTTTNMAIIATIAALESAPN